MLQLRVKGKLPIQDFDLHIPAVIQKDANRITFLRKIMTLPL